jgi:hypothetical protein
LKGRLPKTLQGKLKACANYQTVIKGNPMAILNVIQEHQMSYQENQYNATIVLDRRMKKTFLIIQGDSRLHKMCTSLTLAQR